MSGLIYVITGEGKGKTTAALGSALRASGWGKKVLMVQFCKPEDFETGEKKALESIPDINLKQFGTCSLWGRGRPVFAKGKAAEEEVGKAFKFAEDNVFYYDLVILDEVLYAISGNLLSLDKLLTFLKQKPDEVDIILTGRNVPSQVVKIADIVSEIRVQKYKKTKKNVRGIDY